MVVENGKKMYNIDKLHLIEKLRGSVYTEEYDKEFPSCSDCKHQALASPTVSKSCKFRRQFEMKIKTKHYGLRWGFGCGEFKEDV